MADKQTFGMILPEFQIVFPSLFEAKAFGEKGGKGGKGDKKFSYTGLFDADADLSEVKAMAMACAKAKWPGLANIGTEVRWPFKNGDKEADRLIAKGKTEDKVKFYRGKVVIKASTGEEYPPAVLIRNGSNIEDCINPREVYSGCFCRSRVTFSATEMNDDGETKRYVSIYFNDVIKMREGPRIVGYDAKSAYQGLLGAERDVDPTAGDDIKF